MLLRRHALPALAMAMLPAAPSAAADVWIGGYKHAVHQLPTSRDTGQGGYDVQFGYRFGRIAGLGFIGGPAPYLIGSINTAGGSSFGGAGLGWKIGAGPLYVRPGIGVVVQSKWHRKYDGRDRVDLGSPVLFEPELAIGYTVAPRVSIEASWTHVSHAQIFSSQNPGIDMLGARLVLHLL